MPFQSHAQNLEDVMLWRALKHVPHGFYVDVGACDPDAESVTKAFYDRGWSGINIEPSALAYQRLAAARPRDLNLRLACGADEGEIDFLLVDGGNGLSTAQVETEPGLRCQRWPTSRTRVQSRRLSSICEDHVHGPVHFLKVDCEGAEHDVLAGADLLRWRPWIAVVEATVANSREPTHARWEHLLTEHGYTMVYADGLNRFYLADEHRELAGAFAFPPNVFDDYVVAGKTGLADAEPGSLAAVMRERDDAVQQMAALTLERDAALQEVWENNRLVGELSASRQTLLEGQSTALAAVLGSTSWRVTAPLRAAMRLVRRG